MDCPSLGYGQLADTRAECDARSRLHERVEASACFKNTLQHGATGVSSGYQNVLVDFTGPVAGVGARAEFVEPGRLLTDVYPFRRSSTAVRAYAESKDHQKSASGTTHVYSIGLALR